MDLPDFMVTSVLEGRCILVLGAGASREALDARGRHPPTARELARQPSTRFLGGGYGDLSLSETAELAISESDLVAVQEYISDMVRGFEPSTAHRLMTLFRWWGLATTNYDTLIEMAYDRPEALQKCRPRISNMDRVDNALRDPQAAMLLKLHGCITRTADDHCPLILTPEQYIDHRKGRERLFDMLKEWAIEHPVVFIGHSLQDPDLRALLHELTSAYGEARPRYYAVIPDCRDEQRKLWEARKVTLINATFEEYMRSLDATAPRAMRRLPALSVSIPTPIAQRFVHANWSLSANSRQFVDGDAEYVTGVAATDPLIPQDFYRGYSPGWSAVEQKLDVHRGLVDTVIVDHFLADELARPRTTEFVLIKGHAGAGKSVLLRRVAWDAAREYGCICLFMRSHGVISPPALQEIIQLCGARCYLFVDDAADRVRELRRLADTIGDDGRRLTVIAAERVNEWNVACSSISDLVTAEHELRYLNAREVDELLSLLEKHHALGTLAHLGMEERRAAFTKRAGRQLLVALHEATLGRPFEDIIADEYANIHPDEAQRICLTICVLNRLNVGVRAGIVSRIHGVPFDDFRQRFFAPLERIVRVRHDPSIRDYVYQARHAHIAEIVFDRVLRNAEERYDAYIRCLRALDIGYADDRSAYRQMVRGRSVLEWFPDHSMARSVFQVAAAEVGEDSYLLHQTAVYEMNRPNGSMQVAGELLDRAHALAPGDTSIRHSMAERYLKSAEQARTPLERSELLRRAEQAASAIRSERPQDPPSYHTLIKVGILRLQDLVEAQDAAPLDIAEAVRRLEGTLSDALQRFPDEPYILEAEARFGSLTSDAQRVRAALRRAFEANPRNAYVATRLSRCYSDAGQAPDARTTLEQALEHNPGDRALHYAYARLLIDAQADGVQIAHHLRRAFSPGDRNYDAQALYGRQLFLNKRYQESVEFFRETSASATGTVLRSPPRYVLESQCHGSVTRKEAGYCFVEMDGNRYSVFVYAADVDDAVWDSLVPGSRVAFQVGFTVRGARALNLVPI